MGAAESADPHCLRPGEAQALLARHPWRRFAALGDSIAEGVCEPLPGHSPLPFADRVAAELADPLAAASGLAPELALGPAPAFAPALAPCPAFGPAPVSRQPHARALPRGARQHRSGTQDILARRLPGVARGQDQNRFA